MQNWQDSYSLFLCFQTDGKVGYFPRLSDQSGLLAKYCDMHSIKALHVTKIDIEIIYRHLHNMPSSFHLNSFQVANRKAQMDHFMLGETYIVLKGIFYFLIKSKNLPGQMSLEYQLNGPVSDGTSSRCCLQVLEAESQLEHD